MARLRNSLGSVIGGEGTGHLHVAVRILVVLALVISAGTSDALAAAKGQVTSKVTLGPGTNSGSPTPGATTARGGRAEDVTSAELERLRKALELTDRQDWRALRVLANEKSNSTVEKLVQWLCLTQEASGASFDELSEFLRSNAGWPRQGVLQSIAEKRMPGALDANAVRAWFKDRQPDTGIGMVRLGQAEIAAGDRRSGADRIRRAWLTSSFEHSTELEIVAAHGAILPLDVQDDRLARLLYGGDEGAIRRQLARASHAALKKATIRLALQKTPKKGIERYAGLLNALKDDPHVMFDAARGLRKLGRTGEARRLLLRAVRLDDQTIPRLRWWPEVVLSTREALRERAYQEAYELASQHHLERGAEFADAEFLAGWIALKYLSKPELGLKHFKNLEQNVSRPISVARAHYWIGRALEGLKKTEEARAHYEVAARKPYTFYGQLALTRFGARPVLRLAPQIPPSPSTDELAKDKRAVAFRNLAAANVKDKAREFALRIARDDLTAAKATALIALANNIGDRPLALKIAKLAEYQDIVLADALHPTDVPGLMDMSEMLSIPKAEMLALIRQESEFDVGSVSAAGARGLMQLMPATAKQRAKPLGLTYSLSRLTSDANYNIQLGTAHFRASFDAWRGSSVLAIASYNAGASNVRKWIETYGDPRDPTIDTVDWIELIPFAETRNYVQRVIENIHVYQSRLAGREQPLEILNALHLSALPPPKSGSRAGKSASRTHAGGTKAGQARTAAAELR